MRKDLIAFISLLIWCIIPMKMQGQTYDKLWKQVEAANNKGLPQTVVKLTGEIFEKARKEKNSPQMLKAYTVRSQYRQGITPDSFYVDLKGLEEWARTTENTVDRAVLHTIIAGVYSNYAQSNQWQLRQRTDLTGDIPEDIREWSSNLFIDKVLQHTDSALNNVAPLLATSSKAYLPFVELGNASEYYRHDMYHLLALKGADQLQEVIYLDNSGKIMKAIGLIFGNLIRTYNEQGNKDAFLLATLDSLQWRNSYERPADYLRLLDSLIAENSAREVCVEVYLEKINQLIENDRYVEALQIADETIARYPRYNRINAVRNTKEYILKPDINASADATIYPGTEFQLAVNHRNISGFSVEYYQVNLPVTSLQQVNIHSNEVYAKRYVRKISAQHFNLIAPEDYLRKDTLITLTAPSEGLYLMRIVPDGKPGNTENRYLSVTRLKLLTRKLPGNQFEAVVLDGMTGHPVSDASIRLFADKKGEWTEKKVFTTNAEGKVLTAWDNNYQYLTVEKGTDKAMLLQRINQGFYYYNDNTGKETTLVKLLTDRSLYRPGQTVHVKGIAYTQKADTAHIIPDRLYMLRLQDSNGREVYKKQVRTNDFGSFTEDIVLPSGGLNGMYTLSTEYGSTNIRVEEYKRPTFDITFEPQEEAYRLGDSIRITGNVKTYSGISVQDVPVSYTVTRRMRGWWGLYMGTTTLTASGNTQVDDDGNFSIPVLLSPDDKQNSDEGFYTYTIEATATNVAGETQSSSVNVSAGIRSLLLATNIYDKVNRDDTIKAVLGATNLDGRPVDVNGQYKLYTYADYKTRRPHTNAVFTGTFVSNKEMVLDGVRNLPSGAYKLVVSANDPSGREATFEQEVILFSLSDTRPAAETSLWYHPVNTRFDAANPASFIFGTSEKEAYVLMDVFSGEQRIESRVLYLNDSLVRFDYPYLPAYGNGLSISFCLVKNGRTYLQDVKLEKRLPEKELKMKWEVFRDKLRPGQQEEWRLTIKDPQGLPANAEMLATLYDASLDKIWKADQSLRLYYSLALPTTAWMDYYAGRNSYGFWFNQKRWDYPELTYDDFKGITYVQYEVTVRGYGSSRKSTRTGSVLQSVEHSGAAILMDNMVLEESVIVSSEMGKAENDAGALPPPADDLRTNFAETAFFYPQLRTNGNGEIVLSFTMPESLTRWNFRGYAHTKGMLTGMLNGETVTSKEFMLTPNLPRFVRVGDQTSVAASVTNTTGERISGNVIFTLFDPVTEKVISTQKQKFTAEAGKSTGVTFAFTATDKYDLLGCRIVADGGTFSDGEQHLLPVLSNKERIIETVPMPVRGKETREFSLESLFNNNSKTATNRMLTVEFSGNPAWYAIQALPVISMPDNENAISWAAALYANNLASYIANTQPRIKTIFDAWKMQGGSKETLLSNLQKNEDVKNILLEESPWLMEATSETEQMQRIGTLFDLNTVSNNTVTALNRLKELQLNSGAWTWYKGMSGSPYITTYVVQTLVRLQEMTGQTPDSEVAAMLKSAFNFLHKEALEEYKRMREAEKQGGKITGVYGNTLEYLYLVAISGESIPDANKTAHNYFLNKVYDLLSTRSVREKALSAIVLHKAGRTSQANEFMASLKEYLVQTDELGMYFDFNEGPYRWSDLRIPAHVAAMEAFDRITNDKRTVEEMKIWLLKQKQTQQWDSPVSTVNAIYALLQRGSNPLENQGDVRISLGGKVLETTASGENSIPGIGYIKQTYTDKSMVSKPGKVSVEKRDEGIAWGAVYAQYHEEIDKVNRRTGELGVDKKLYVEKVEGTSKQLVPVTSGTPLAVGDKVVSRITITLDRKMDFVQLKDQRGACFEPATTLSGYIWNRGIGYYVAVKDASTNFFFDSLDKGVYVLEYSYRVSRPGVYEGGLATLQSSYAPEYASHSASMKVEVK